jgi:hypothetical protein
MRAMSFILNDELVAALLRGPHAATDIPRSSRHSRGGGEYCCNHLSNRTQPPRAMEDPATHQLSRFRWRYARALFLGGSPTVDSGPNISAAAGTGGASELFVALCCRREWNDNATTVPTNTTTRNRTKSSSAATAFLLDNVDGREPVVSDTRRLAQALHEWVVQMAGL